MGSSHENEATIPLDPATIANTGVIQQRDAATAVKTPAPNIPCCFFMFSQSLLPHQVFLGMAIEDVECPRLMNNI